jgi:hypothetical protein
MRKIFNGDRFRTELKKPLSQIMLVCFIIYLSVFITNQFTVASDFMNFLGVVAFFTFLFDYV